MRGITFIVNVLICVSGALSQCSTVTSVVVPSPSLWCEVNACASCDNGDYVSTSDAQNNDKVETDIASIYDVLNASPVDTNALQEALQAYAYSIQEAPSTSVITCLSPSDYTNLLDSVGNAVDQFEIFLQQASADITSALGNTLYKDFMNRIVYGLNLRFDRTNYFLWLSRDCVDWDQVAVVNAKRDALAAHYPVLFPDLGPGADDYHLKNPCRAIITYSTIATACPASDCRATPVPTSVCSSCTAAEAKVGRLQSRLSAAASHLSAAVAYATTTPLQVPLYYEELLYEDGSGGGSGQGIVLGLDVPGGSECLNSKLAHTVLTSMTSYISAVAWAFEYAGILMPVHYYSTDFVDYYYADPVLSVFYTNTRLLQASLSNPSSCYDCNDVAEYNAALNRVRSRWREYLGFYFDTPNPYDQVPTLQLACTSCPISSSSMASESSSTQQSSASSKVSSTESASSVSYSSESSASPVPASESSSASESSASESASESSASKSFTVSSTSSASDSSASYSSAGFSSSSVTFESSTLTESSLETEPSFSSNLSPQVASAVSTAASTGSKSYLSAEPASSPVSIPSASGYSNFSSAVTGHSSVPATATSGSPTAVSNADPDAATSYASTRTFTATTVVTEPCTKCPGGSTTFSTTTLVTEPCDTTPASTRTFTSTAVVTEACSKCVGGSTTYTTTSVVTEPCDSVYTTSTPATAKYAASVSAVSDATSPVLVSLDVTGTSVVTKDTTTYTVTSLVTKTAAVSTYTPGSVSVIVLPSDQASVVAANAGNKKTLASLLLLLIPTLFGM